MSTNFLNCHRDFFLGCIVFHAFLWDNPGAYIFIEIYMKLSKDFYVLFSLLVITGVLFSGCGQTIPTDTNSTASQETVSTIQTQTTSEPSGSVSSEDLNPTESTMESQEVGGSSGSSQETQSTSQETQTTVSYKNGTFSQSGSYKSPAGDENATFQFTIADNVVTGVELTTTAENQLSKKFQGFFIDGIKKEIIGKKVDELGTFSRVNGSSLTPTAFNQAVTALKAEAQG